MIINFGFIGIIQNIDVPFLVPYPFEDRVANEVKKQKNDAEVFCSRLKTMRAGLKKVGQALMQSF